MANRNSYDTVNGCETHNRVGCRQCQEADLALCIMVQAADPTRTPKDLADRMADMATVHFVAAARIAAGHHLCPGCSGVGLLTDDPQVLRCTGCGGVFTNPSEPITREQAGKFVALQLPMISGGEARFSIETFYFDLDVVNLNGWPADRLHGWADRRTKRVVQWG